MFALFPCPYVEIVSRQDLCTLLHHCKAQGIAAPTVVSPLHAGCSLGLPWWQAVLEGYQGTSLLDCGTAAGLALQALSIGISGVICRQYPAALPPEYQGHLVQTRPHTKNLYAWIKSRNEL